MWCFTDAEQSRYGIAVKNVCVIMCVHVCESARCVCMCICVSRNVVAVKIEAIRTDSDLSKDRLGRS